MLIVIHFIAIMILGVYRAPQDNSPVADRATLFKIHLEILCSRELVTRVLKQKGDKLITLTYSEHEHVSRRFYASRVHDLKARRMLRRFLMKSRSMSKSGAMC